VVDSFNTYIRSKFIKLGRGYLKIKHRKIKEALLDIKDTSMLFLIIQDFWFGRLDYCRFILLMAIYSINRRKSGES
jgi:hypothetical protein